MLLDKCVRCEVELSLLERNRSVCWDCQDTFSVTYADDSIER
jgi:hypothetical protein